MALHRSATAVLAATLGLTLFGCSHEGPQASLGSDIGLYFNKSGPTATLAYGRANSDDVGLVLQCQAGSRLVDVSDVARNARADSLTLTSGKAQTRLPARLDTATGQPTLWAKADVGNPALAAFRQTGAVVVAAGGTRYRVDASRQEMAGVQAFFRTCDRA